MDSKTKNRKTRHEIERMARRAFGGVGLAAGTDAMRELKEGWFNVAYDLALADGRAVILKIAPPKEAEVLAYEKNLMQTEVASLRLVAGSPAIPAPKVYFFDQTHDLCDSDYFFMEKLPGENFERVRDSLPPETRAAISFRIGEIVRAINEYEGNGYFGYPGNPALRGERWSAAFLKMIHSVLEDGCRRRAEYGRGYDEIRAAIEAHAPALDAVTAPVLVHWDAWDSNILVAEGRITGIIDFERALWGDPLMEAQFRPIFGEPVTESMRGYGKTALTFEEEQRSRLYTLYLGLAMNTECYYRHYENDSIYKESLGILDVAMSWMKSH